MPWGRGEATVSTHLKHISQIGSFPQIYRDENEKYLKPPSRKLVFASFVWSLSWIFWIYQHSWESQSSKSFASSKYWLVVEPPIWKICASQIGFHFFKVRGGTIPIIIIPSVNSGMFSAFIILVGAFNPSEKYERQNRNLPQITTTSIPLSYTIIYLILSHSMTWILKKSVSLHRPQTWSFDRYHEFLFEEELGVSKNRGTPKWMIYNGKPY